VKKWPITEQPCAVVLSGLSTVLFLLIRTVMETTFSGTKSISFILIGLGAMIQREGNKNIGNRNIFRTKYASK
jgi:hypothetical protein